MVVGDWKVGWRVNKDMNNLVIQREEIADLVKRFMDSESDERREMRRRVRQLQKISHGAIAEGGSSETNINAFIGDIANIK